MYRREAEWKHMKKATIWVSEQRLHAAIRVGLGLGVVVIVDVIIILVVVFNCGEFPAARQRVAHIIMCLASIFKLGMLGTLYSRVSTRGGRAAGGGPSGSYSSSSS